MATWAVTAQPAKMQDPLVPRLSSHDDHRITADKIEDLLFRTVDAAGTVQMAAQVPSTSKFEVSNPVSNLAFK